MKTKLLGIDHGSKHLGLAISDSAQIMAIPYKTLDNSKNIFNDLKAVCEKEDIAKIILGLPLAMSGEDSKQTEQVRRFAQDLTKELDLPVEFEDERLSTKMVERIFEHSEKDIQSAVIILQNYLDKQG